MVTAVPDLASRLVAPPQIQSLFNAFPMPNGPDLGNGAAEFTGSYSDPSTLDATSIRVDHRVNAKLSLFGRYSYSTSDATQRASFGATSVLSNPTSTQVTAQTITLGIAQSLTPRLSNEGRANYSRTTANNIYKLDSFGGAVPASVSAFLPASVPASDSLFSVFVGGAGLWLVGNNGHNEQRQLNLIDNLSLTVEKHQLKFGVDYRRLSPVSRSPGYQQTAVFAGVPGAPSGEATLAITNSLQPTTFISSNFSSYAQDTWRVMPRLTLTYGFRWDINPAVRGENGKDPAAVQNVNNPAALNLATPGSPLYNTTYGNFAPRVGGAYQLSVHSGWERVLRGGFGMFYDLGSGSLGNLSSFYPFAGQNLFSNVPFPLTAIQAAPPPFPSGPPVSNVLAADPNLELPRTYQWNVSLEQSLGSNDSVSATYVGAVGRKLLKDIQFLQPNPDFSSVHIVTNDGSSGYNALQLQFKRRLSRGLQALASYTWSHSIDNASVDSNQFVPAGTINPSSDRASSDFDIRHSFTSALSYDIPGPKASWLGRALARNWSVDTFFLARSAAPVNLFSSAASFLNYSADVRPDVVPGQPFYLYAATYPGGFRFNPAAFTAPPTDASGNTLQQGDLARNALRGFNAWQMDTAIRRSFSLTESVTLQLHAEFFNIFNHPNFGSPVADIADPLFGQSTQMLGRSMGNGGPNGGFDSLYQIGGPRSVQLALKLQF
jgi:hypothetical protein